MKKVRRVGRTRTIAKPTFVGEFPTPEQQRQRPFAIEPVVEDGQVVARAYHRQPLYMTLSKTSDALSGHEIAALDLYREMNDRADRSFTKSCLDLDGNGSLRKPDAIVHVSNAVRLARELITQLEASIGPIVSTLRAVALEDRTFSDVAMERFGSRVRSWILVNEPVTMNGKPVMKDGKPVFRAVEREELVPRSGRHREVIRDEYRQAVKMLVDAVDICNRGGRREEVWVAPIASGGCRIYRGPMGPKGAFRLSGNEHAVNATFADLATGLKGELQYPDYPSARAALAKAAQGWLVDIDAPSVFE